MNEAIKDTRPGTVVFFLGTAGSGKTHRCLARLREHEAASRPAILLVPEQSTYLADRELLEPPGPQAARHARVVSFRRLATLLAPDAAPPSSRTIDASGRRILLRALLNRLDDDIRRPLQTILHRPGFTESLAAILRDLRAEGGFEGWDRLQRLARGASMPAGIAEKLRALAAVAEAYDREILARGLRDPEQALAELPHRVRAARDRIAGTAVEVDGFLSFTRTEAETLYELARAGAALSISLCVDPDAAAAVEGIEPPPPSFRLDDWPRDLLARIDQACILAPLRTLVELRARLRAGGVGIRIEPIRTDGTARRFRSGDLALLEERIFRRSVPEPRAWTNLEVVAARDPSHEVEIWAKRIDGWLRAGEASARPGEIAVIVRDLDSYRPLVERTFARWGIPIFVDRHWDLASRPAVRTVLDALEVFRSGWQRTAVISFLRSPLLGSRGGEVDLLENLSIEAGCDYGDWKELPWAPIPRPPRTRFVRGGEGRSDDPVEIEEEERGGREEKIENARVKTANRVLAAHLAPLLEMERRLGEPGATGRDAVERLREWIDGAGLRRGIDGENAEDRRKEWAAIDHVLGQIAAEWGDEPLPLAELTPLLAAGLDSLKLGRTPTGLDRVTLAEVQRSRLGPVRRAIVGGVAAGLFPRNAAHERFFNESERKRLAEMGIDLGPSDPLRQEEEAYFYYIALTRASEEVLVTRPAADLEGNSVEPSPFVRETLRAANGLREATPAVLVDPADLAAVQTADELAAQIGAAIAARLARGREERRGASSSALDSSSALASARAPAPAEDADRRILTAYNRLLAPPFAAPPKRSSPLAATSILWGYDNRPILPPEIVAAAFRGGEIAASVGRLESFARCPYQHFAKHLLRIQARPRAAVTPVEAGVLTHRALEVLCGAGDLPTDRAKLAERILETFGAIEKEDALRAFEIDPSGRFRRTSARGQLLRFLEVEAIRVAGSDFKPERMEQEFGTRSVDPLVIEIPGGGRFLLRGRIDRIDTAHGGGTAEAIVLDYKSRPEIASDRGRPKKVLEGFDLQLAVYLMVVEEVLGMTGVGALYAPVLPRPVREAATDPRNPLGIKLVGLVPNDQRDRVAGGLDGILTATRPAIESRAALEDLLRDARALIAQLGKRMLEGRIDIAPVGASSRLACAYCDFAPLCRFDRAHNDVRKSPRDCLTETPAIAPPGEESGK